MSTKNKALQASDLPALPDGWNYEMHATNENVWHVVWPDHGANSINFVTRRIGLGWCDPGPRNTDKTVKGLGWREQLVANAVADLRAAWKSP